MCDTRYYYRKLYLSNARQNHCYTRYRNGIGNKKFKNSSIRSSFLTANNNKKIQTHACARARNTHGDSFGVSTHELARLAIYSPSRLAHLLNRTKPEEWRRPCAATRREKRIRSTFSLESERPRPRERRTARWSRRGREGREASEKERRDENFLSPNSSIRA